MFATLALTLPIFSVIGLGWVLAKVGIFGPEIGAGLAKFVFWLAFPSLLASAMINSPPPSLSLWSAMGLYCCCMLSVQIIAHLAGGIFGLSKAQSAVAAITGSCGNTAFIGTSVVVAAFGPTALPIAAGLVVVENVIGVGVAAAGLYLAKTSGGSLVAAIRRALNGALNPVSAGAMIGLFIASIGVDVPDWALRPFQLLGAAASPAGLVALGITLAGIKMQGIRSMKPAVLATSLKCVALPLLVFSLMTALMIEPKTIAIACVLAACPAAVNGFIQAQAADVAASDAAVSVFLSTLVSILSVTFAVSLMG